MPPHAAMNAPSGARKPRTLTEAAFSLFGASEGIDQHEIAADDRGDHAAGLDRQVCRRPEGVSADRAMPGDVPRASDRG